MERRGWVKKGKRKGGKANKGKENIHGGKDGCGYGWRWRKRRRSTNKEKQMNGRLGDEARRREGGRADYMDERVALGRGRVTEGKIMTEETGGKILEGRERWGEREGGRSRWEGRHVSLPITCQ